MASKEFKAPGVELRAGGEEAAPSMGLDADVRGFTGLLVGLAIGTASWALILMIWWLV
jgi:hypothetical protein